MRLLLKIRKLLFFFAFVLLLCCSIAPAVFAEKWSGIDESVIEKYASEHGREAREPLINTDQGDLLLFVFLLAGAIGGFFAGYYYKELTTRAEIGHSTEITVKSNISGKKQKF